MLEIFNKRIKRPMKPYFSKGETVGFLTFTTGFSGTVTGDCTFNDADGVALRLEFELTVGPSLILNDFGLLFNRAQLVTTE